MNSREIFHYYEYITYLLNKEASCYPSAMYGGVVNKGQVLKAWRRSVELAVAGRGSKALFMYVHIPFCQCACLYCMSGTVGVKQKGKFIGDYLAQIFREMAYYSPAVRGLTVSSVYIGGGTPSILAPAQIEALVANMRKYFDFGPDSRIIFEASPFTLDREKLDLLKRLAIHELALGVQSFDREVLRKNYRPQSNEQVIGIIRCAQELGFPSVTADIMVGMPYQSGASALASVKQAIALGVDAIHLNEFLPVKYIRYFTDKLTYSAKDMAERKKAVGRASKALAAAGYKCTPGGHRKKWTPEDARLVYKTQESGNLIGFGYGSYSHAYGAMKYQQTAPFKDFSRWLNLGKVLMKNAGSNFDSVYCGKNLAGRGTPASGAKRPRLPFSYIGLPLDISREMAAYAYTNLFNISPLKFKNLFGAEFADVFRRQLKVLTALGLVKLENGGLQVLTRAAHKAKVVTTFFVDKDYINKAISVSGLKYDPRADYTAKIREFTREKE